MKYNLFVFILCVLLSLCSFSQQSFADENNKIINVFNILLAGPEKVTQFIEAQNGGTLTLSNGVSIMIPANALSEDTEISLGEVEVEKFDGVINSIGAVNGLHIAGAIFEPDGTVLNEPAVVRFPLPKDWDIDTELVWFAANSNDPFEVLPTTDKVTVTGLPGSYVAEVSIFHFSSGSISRNCHSGTFRTVVSKFTHAGCTEDKIVKEVKNNYPDHEIDADKAKETDNYHIQAFLHTFFDEYKEGRANSFYNKGEVVSEATLDSLKAAVRSGREVVIAFNTSEDWPQTKHDIYKDFYKTFAHTATLVADSNGTVDVHHVIQHAAYSKEKRDKLIKSMGGTLYYRTPFDQRTFQSFREEKNGLAFKEYIQSKFGKIIDGVWVPDYNDDFFTVSRKNSYHSVNIYIDKRTNSSDNPCGIDFSYEYSDPLSEEADDYIVQSTNMTRREEGDFRYWYPENGGHIDGENPGELLFHFPFDKNVKSAYLRSAIHTFHWSYSKGHGFLYGSKDGTEWVKLIEVNPPSYGDYNYEAFNQLLPETLTGSQDLWFKVSLFAFPPDPSDKNPGDSVYANTVQFSRYREGNTGSTFRLDVQLEQ